MSGCPKRILVLISVGQDESQMRSRYFLLLNGKVVIDNTSREMFGSGSTGITGSSGALRKLTSKERTLVKKITSALFMLEDAVGAMRVKPAKRPASKVTGQTGAQG